MARTGTETPTIVGATARSEQLWRRLTLLRGKAALAASHAELQEAATRGDLVCWQECKLVSENGSRKFSPGEAMPDLDKNHVLLEPDRRLVTTQERWQAVQAYKSLSTYVRERQPPIEAVWRQATSAHDAYAAKVEELRTQLATEEKRLHQAEVARSKAEFALQCFVERAPR